MAAERATLTFWGTSLGAAATFAALVGVLFPFGRLGLVTAADRERAWLLTVFCAGVLLAMFGLSTWIGGARLLTIRDVVEAGGVKEAAERRRQAHRPAADGLPYTRNAAAWAVATGGFLVAIYFALWRAL